MASRLGFTRPLSFTLFLLFPVVFAVFSFSQHSWLVTGRSSFSSPSETLVFTQGSWLGWAKLFHLWCVLPAGMLLPLQFVPALRRKYRAAHRWSGRILFLLLVAGNTAGMGISHASFGGTIETVIWIYTLGPMVFYSMWRAWRTAWKKDYQAHRVWTIRTWGWAGSILTMRPTMFILAWLICSPYTRTFYAVGTCKWVGEIYEKFGVPTDALVEKYPTCLDGKGSFVKRDAVVAIRTGFKGPEERVVTMNMTFGTAGWLAMVVHMVVIEWWLSSTRDSSTGVKGKRS